MIQTEDGYRITVSKHAAQIALRRIPALEGRRFVDAVYWAENVTLAALRDGRKSCNHPRWAVRTWANGFSHRRKLQSAGAVRFVWPESQDALLVIGRDGKRNGIEPERWHVITVMSPGV